MNDETFLAPLVALARKRPDLDGLLFWASPGWTLDPSDEMDAEELPFYLEGLFGEGLALAWRILAAADAPTLADHVRLYVSEAARPLPEPPQGWIVLAEGRRA